MELTYKDPGGRVSHEVLYRADERRLEVVEKGRSDRCVPDLEAVDFEGLGKVDDRIRHLSWALYLEAEARECA